MGNSKVSTIIYIYIYIEREREKDRERIWNSATQTTIIQCFKDDRVKRTI